MDRRRYWCASTLRGLPRPRGDGPSSGSAARLLPRAPPPTRGWTALLDPHQVVDVGSPAHAGMDRPAAPDPPTTSVAPPPTRGWTRAREETSHHRAGGVPPPPMDPRARGDLAPGHRLPRPRGDGPTYIACVPPSTWAPPPTRGWTRRGRPATVIPGGSPAHAGMNRRGCRAGRCGSRLPRPRGDGPPLPPIPIPMPRPGGGAIPPQAPH